jgi:phosphatidate cytidylyltransferase
VFKQRVVTGMILALAVFGAIAFVNSELLAVLVLIMLLVGGWEWANLVGIQNNAARAGYLILTAAACAAVVWFAPLNLVAIYAGTAWWTFVVVLLSFIRHVPHGASPLHYLLKAAGPPVLAVLLASIYWIHQQGWQWLFYLVLLTSLADTGAYLSGKTFGKRKLAPELSPGKTLEGLFGALLFSGVAAAAAGKIFGLPLGDGVYLVLLSLLVVVVSVFGDLFESLLKRAAGAKDSGHILPGHGGILDRVDSLTAAAPVFALGLRYMH